MPCLIGWTRKTEPENRSWHYHRGPTVYHSNNTHWFDIIVEQYLDSQRQLVEDSFCRASILKVLHHYDLARFEILKSCILETTDIDSREDTCLLPLKRPRVSASSKAVTSIASTLLQQVSSPPVSSLFGQGPWPCTPCRSVDGVGLYHDRPVKLWRKLLVRDDKVRGKIHHYLRV
jgi:hypothetical protein